MTVPYAEVIGDPIAQSKSPIIHGFWLDKLGIEGAYRRRHVTAEELPGYFAERRTDSAWRGCNVTMPHKMAMMPFLSALAPFAERLGAVNTIVRDENARLIGHNTDVAGVAEPLRAIEKATYPNYVTTYVYIIGAGGAARAAVAGAAAAGYGDFDIFNRSVEKAHILAAEAGTPFSQGHPLDALSPIRNLGDGPADQRYSHVIINATNMGMDGLDPVPIDLAEFYPDTIVFDMVYSPLETMLLKQARDLGLRTIDGLDMLIGQAAPAFELFFNVAPPRQYDAELRTLLMS